MKDQDNWKYIKLACVGTAVVLVGLACYFLIEKVGVIQAALGEIAKILMPFVYGAVIAYLLAPACNWFERKLKELLGEDRKRLAEAIAIILSIVMALLVLWALVMLVIPQLVTSVLNLVETLPRKIQDTNAWFHTLLDDQPELQRYWDVVSNQIFGKLQAALSEENVDKLMGTAQTLLNNVGSGLFSAMAAVLDFIVGIIVSVYFLAERKKFLAQAKLALYAVVKKKWADMIADEVAYADMMFGGFITGKILDSAIIGIICFICVSIMGLPSAALISTIVGVTNVIPFFGPFIGAIPCALLLLLESPLYCLYFVIFVLVLQQADGNIIGPKILGDTTGLSSFWVLFAILLFGGKWGLVGMVIGVPLFAVIYDLIRRFIIRGLRRNQQEEMLAEYNRTFGAPAPGEKNPTSPRSRKEKKETKKR